MVAVPVMKLFSLTVKTVAKPVAKRMKSEAERHPRVRGVLNTMGQVTNSLSARISVRMAGHTTTKIKPLEEDKAVAAGGDLLAEGMIYGLGIFLMVWEYVSSATEKEEKEAASKLKKKQEQMEIANAIEAINERLARLEAARSSPPDPGNRCRDRPDEPIDSKRSTGDAQSASLSSTSTSSNGWGLSGLFGRMTPPRASKNREGKDVSNVVREFSNNVDSSKDTALVTQSRGSVPRLEGQSKNVVADESERRSQKGSTSENEDDLDGRGQRSE